MHTANMCDSKMKIRQITLRIGKCLDLLFETPIKCQPLNSMMEVRPCSLIKGEHIMTDWVIQVERRASTFPI